MIITTIATFTMRVGKVPGALQLVRAVKDRYMARSRVMQIP